MREVGEQFADAFRRHGLSDGRDGNVFAHHLEREVFDLGLFRVRWTEMPDARWSMAEGRLSLRGARQNRLPVIRFNYTDFAADR